jgi:hypothetical protein
MVLAHRESMLVTVMLERWSEGSEAIVSEF